MNTEKALKHTDPAYLHSDLTDIANGAFYRVYNGMGFGFLESVYRNALAKELSKAGVTFEREVPVDVESSWSTICEDRVLRLGCCSTLDRSLRCSEFSTRTIANGSVQNHRSKALALKHIERALKDTDNDSLLF